jgi:S-adenosylmethionine synthetase
MGQSASCESDEVSCSSAFATCRTQHCTSSCAKKVKELEAALAPLEIIAQEAIKKFLEDNLHNLLQEHLPVALATHFEAVGENLIDIIVTPDEPVPTSPEPAVDAIVPAPNSA